MLIVFRMLKVYEDEKARIVEKIKLIQLRQFAKNVKQENKQLKR